MTDESATSAFDLDAALESAYTSVTENKVDEAEPVTEEETPAALAPEGEEKPTSGTEGKPEAEKPIEAPVSWTSEAKEGFAKLPPELQKYVSQRESEREKLLTQKSTEYSEQQRKNEALEQVLSPRRQALVDAYGSESQGLHQILSTVEFANRDPAGFMKWFAQQNGLATPAAQTEADDTYVDPVTKQIQQELNGIKQKLTQDEQAKISLRQETVRSEITTFKDEKDDSGALKRPHFEEVRAEMASLMQSGSAKNLDDAYDKACWANPGVRKQILETSEKAKEAQRLDAAKQAASKAEKAKGVTVRTKKAGETAPSKKGSWEDTLTDTAEELYGSAS